jgi:hypothetical protein
MEITKRGEDEVGVQEKRGRAARKDVGYGHKN